MSAGISGSFSENAVSVGGESGLTLRGKAEQAARCRAGSAGAISSAAATGKARPLGQHLRHQDRPKAVADQHRAGMCQDGMC